MRIPLPKHETRWAGADDADVVAAGRLLDPAEERHYPDGVVFVDGLRPGRGLVVGVIAIGHHVRVHVHVTVTVTRT